MLEQVTVDQIAAQTDLLEFRLRMSRLAQSEIFRLHLRRKTADALQLTLITSEISALEEHTFEESSRVAASAHFAYGVELAETLLSAFLQENTHEMEAVSKEIKHACLITKLGFNSRMRDSGLDLHVQYESSVTPSLAELAH